MTDLEKMERIHDGVGSDFRKEFEKIGQLVNQKLTKEIKINFNDKSNKEKTLIYTFILDSLKQEFNISFLTGLIFPKE